MIKKIAIIFPGNVDKLIDYREHAQNISKTQEIHLFCRECSLSSSPSLKIHFIRSNTRNPLLRRVLFFVKSFVKVRRLSIHAAITYYGLGASIFGLLVRLGNVFSSHKCVAIFDLRSGSVSGRIDSLINFIHKLESSIFHKRVALSVLLGQYVFGSNAKFDVVGIGTRKAVPMDPAYLDSIIMRFNIDRSKLIFIYAGIFTDRHIHIFFEKFDLKDDVQIILAGDGTEESMNLVKDSLDKKALISSTIFTGWISYDVLQALYTIADVGIAYVPNQKHFQLQPPTKLYDYAEFGMTVITTKTEANISAAAKLQKVYMIEDLTGLSVLNLRKKKQGSIGVNKQPGIPYWDDLSQDWIHLIQRYTHV